MFVTEIHKIFPEIREKELDLRGAIAEEETLRSGMRVMECEGKRRK